MSTNPLLEYYESLVRFIGEPPEEQNPHLHEYIRESATPGKTGSLSATCATGPASRSAAVKSIASKIPRRIAWTATIRRAPRTDHCYLCIPRGEEKLRAHLSGDEN